MGAKPRLSLIGVQVLKIFFDSPGQGMSGSDLRKQIVVSSGTLYPLLARLEEAGWVKSEWENIDPSFAGRPRKRLYKLTSLGSSETNAILSPLNRNKADGHLGQLNVG